MGGGVLVGTAATYSSPTIRNCRFIDNYGVVGGGGIGVQKGSPRVENCLFMGNVTGGNGGAMSIGDTNDATNIIGCTFAGNDAVADGGGVSVTGTGIKLSNCILWGNTDGGASAEDAQVHVAGGGSVTIDHSCLEGMTSFSGNDNIGEDPLFADANRFDYRLSADSPCLDAGDNGAVSAEVQTDLIGRPRITYAGWKYGGAPGSAVVDMGAYEATPSGCDGDADGDCDQDDFGVLQVCLADTIPAGCTRWDVNCDGLIDGADVDLTLVWRGSSGAMVPLDLRWGDWNADAVSDGCQSLDDTDGDGVPDLQDNCSGVYNPYQTDSNGNGTGDACEPELPESPGGGGPLYAEMDDPPGAPETAGLASAVSLSVVGNPYPGPYVNSRTESAGFDDPFVVWTWVEADGDLDGLQYRLRVNSGDDDDLFRLVEYAEGPLSWWDPWFDGFGELFVISGGFGTGDYGKLSVPVALDAVGRDEVVFNITRYVAADVFPETLVGYVIEPVAPLAAGDYVFSAGGSALTGGVPLWVASPLSGTTSDDQPFTLTIAGE